MVLQEKGTKQVRARFVVRQFRKFYGDANFYNPTFGLEVTRVLLAMALSICVAFMNTSTLEGDLVWSPEGLEKNNGLGTGSSKLDEIVTFHQNPLSSKTTFIRKPLSSKSNFIKNQFQKS